MVDLGVVFVFATSTSLLSLHSPLLKIPEFFKQEAAVLAIQCVLKLQVPLIILSAKVHAHKFGLCIGIDIIALQSEGVFFCEFNLTHFFIVLFQHWRDWPCNH